MSKSSTNFTNFHLADVTTYQSGVVQSTAHRKLNKAINEFLSEYDLTGMQWFIIGSIFDTGPNGISITDLKNKLGTTTPFITNSINLLESRGIITKSSHDKDARTKMIAIYPGYRKTCTEIEVHMRKKMRELIYKDITPEELNIYVKVLYKMSLL